ncbi:MAG: hypothetical protein II712_01350, partial [Erysipelotrichaceae bacterium]|nr:hypothetical protein [Erysipelotrichaceae bacterium]
LAVFLVHLNNRHYLYNEAIVTEWKHDKGLSLGMFIFVWPDDRRVVLHEYGHTVQSRILGPLYLLIIGIPSALWCNLPALRRKRDAAKISYSSFYPEKWADSLGRKSARKNSM